MLYFIHGDDFGRNRSRTDAIDRLLQGGMIQRTTLIVNLSEADYAAGLARKHRYVDSVCFHLNLSEGAPLTEPVKKTKLCNSEGQFCFAQSGQILRTCLSPKSIRAIRQEAEAQMRRFREYGFLSKHLDSHDWLLFNLPVWLAVEPLLSQYGFETTRKGCRAWMKRKKPLRKLYYFLMDRIIAKELKMKENWSGGLRSFESAVKHGDITEKTKAEIMTHPDLVDGDLVDVSKHEYILFTDLLDTLRKNAEFFTVSGEIT